MTDLAIATILSNAAADALAISAKAVEAFDSRCEITKVECEGLHYSACQSRLPDAICSDTIGADFADVEGICREESCGLVYDLDNAMVRIPGGLDNGPDKNPTNLDIIETVCYSTVLDPVFQSNWERSRSPGGVSSVYNYFGSWTGAFRIYPGLSKVTECGGYDPRIRPWYVAASSGPKDVVLIVDISASMGGKGRLDLALDAVHSVLDTMNLHTFVNIVLFSSDATVITDDRKLISATDENKALLLEKLETVKPTGATNFEAAYTTAFDLLEKSRALGEEASSDCKTAILHLTDGAITQGLNSDDVSALISTLNAEIDAEIFTFALGPEADKDSLKKIACNSGGIFQAIPDGGSLSTAMSFFYRYYAIGLGSNTDYTAYSSLYQFSTTDTLGFTVASPAYDRNFDPPAFLGVAGVDFLVQPFLDLGFTRGDIEEAVYLGGRDCPQFNITECQLQNFRGSISAESVCDNSCTTTGASLEPARCMDDGEYPTNLWENVDAAGHAQTDHCRTRTSCFRHNSAALYDMTECERTGAERDCVGEDTQETLNGLPMTVYSGVECQQLGLVQLIPCTSLSHSGSRVITLVSPNMTPI